MLLMIKAKGGVNRSAYRAARSQRDEGEYEMKRRPEGEKTGERGGGTMVARVIEYEKRVVRVLAARFHSTPYQILNAHQFPPYQFPPSAISRTKPPPPFRAYSKVTLRISHLPRPNALSHPM